MQLNDFLNDNGLEITIKYSGSRHMLPSGWRAKITKYNIDYKIVDKQGKPVVFESGVHSVETNSSIGKTPDDAVEQLIAMIRGLTLLLDVPEIVCSIDVPNSLEI